MDFAVFSCEINRNVFICARHNCGLQFLKDRYVQVWIVAKGWKQSQAGILYFIIVTGHIWWVFSAAIFACFSGPCL